MYLVKFRAKETIDWMPQCSKSFIVEEYVETEDPSYARIRAKQSIEKKLKDNIDLQKIEFIGVEKIEPIY